MIDVELYNEAHFETWESVLKNARSGNFMHSRNYMSYHSNRFADQSLIIKKSGVPVAIFPASIHDKTIISHGGLSYAGLISTKNLHTENTLNAFLEIKDFFISAGINDIFYKAIPYIFHTYPSQEDLYALHRLGAQLVRRDISSVINLSKDYKYSKGRKWSINKAKKNNTQIIVSDNYKKFYELLVETLAKFRVSPTHTLEELSYLHSVFPNQITLYEATVSDRLHAGAIIYDYDQTVHVQYMASSEEGRELGALDYLISHLIEKVYSKRLYFSFGISTENSGLILNSGLISQKEAFGAYSIVHDFYNWTLK